MQLTVGMSGKAIIGHLMPINRIRAVSIAQEEGASAKSGLVYYLIFVALISVNLGIINLFPLPVLDCWHLLFIVIEKIKGKPISEQTQNYSYRIGLIILVLLISLALFNDFLALKARWVMFIKSTQERW